MIMVGIVLVGALFVAAMFLLNKGPMDKESGKRQAYWDRYQGK